MRTSGEVGPGDTVGQVVTHRRGAVDHEAHPLVLGGRDVLDQPAQAQIADRRGLGCLLIAEPASCVDQGGPRCRQCGEQFDALGVSGGGRIGHGDGALSVVLVVWHETTLAKGSLRGPGPPLHQRHDRRASRATGVETAQVSMGCVHSGPAMNTAHIN